MNRYQTLLQDVKTRIREVTLEELRHAGEAAGLLIDVREPAEWAAGHIPGAALLPRGILEGKIEDLAPDADQPIVLCCATGGRSALAAESLQRMGYRRVLSLAGGFKAWQAAGLSIER
ncbi:MAG: rhodanese-like domain-containing protein [Pseudomonadota bacterium]